MKGLALIFCMNHHIDPVKTGLAFGKVLGGFHLVWAILVALGWAQAVVNYVLWAHMITIPVTVNVFDVSAAIWLVVTTALVGYVIGFVFAHSLNWFHRK